MKALYELEKSGFFSRENGMKKRKKRSFFLKKTEWRKEKKTECGHADRKPHNAWVYMGLQRTSRTYSLINWYHCVKCVCETGMCCVLLRVMVCAGVGKGRFSADTFSREIDVYQLNHIIRLKKHTAASDRAERRCDANQDCRLLLRELTVSRLFYGSLFQQPTSMSISAKWNCLILRLSSYYTHVHIYILFDICAVLGSPVIKAFVSLIFFGPTTINLMMKMTIFDDGNDHCW